MPFSLPTASVALLLATLASPNPDPLPSQAQQTGGLRFLVTLIAKTERDRRVFEAKLFRLEHVYAEQAKAGKNVDAQLARIKELRAAQMQRYLNAMKMLGEKFGEDRFAEFRLRMEQGRKRSPENVEAIARKLKATADKKAAKEVGAK